MTDNNKSLKQEIKEHFQYKNFEFNKTDGFLAALLTTSIYLYNIQTVYVFFVYHSLYATYHSLTHQSVFVHITAIDFSLYCHQFYLLYLQ